MSIPVNKRGNIEGGLLNDDVIESSKSILQASRGAKGTLKGAQQWFTPPKIAALYATVLEKNYPVIDFQAGGGGAMREFVDGTKFGIEFDRDCTLEPSYEAISGDCQRAVPMLRASGVKFPNVALNPPFDLTWKDPIHAKGGMNSCLLSFLWAQDLLHTNGSGALLMGTTRLKSDLMRLQAARESVYAIVDIRGNLWPSSDLAVSIAFFLHPDNINFRMKGKPLSPEAITIDADDFDVYETATRIRQARQGSADFYHAGMFRFTNNSCFDAFRATRNEYERRRKQRAEARPNEGYDLTYKGAKISAHPANYAKILLAKAGKLSGIEGLNGQAVNYFASNPKAWKIAEECEGRGLITIAPKLKEKVGEVVESWKLYSTPIFPVKEQMRMGWLADLEEIECRMDDPSRGFFAGEKYALHTESVLLSEQTYKPMTNKKTGEEEIRKVQIDQKILKIKVTSEQGTYDFSEKKEDIEYLISYFKIPDPGSVKDLFPDLVEKNRANIMRLEEEIRPNFRAYMEETTGAIDFPDFAFKPFQVDHMSRLLTKGRGLVAHEQGLGKTLQLMTYAKVQILNGADEAVLIMAPQDLIPQWKREARKYYGIELEVIATAEDAIRVDRRVRENGESGWFITHYECLSRNGSKKEALPVVPATPHARKAELRHRAKVRAAKRRAADAMKKENSVSEGKGAKEILSDELAALEARRDFGVMSDWCCPKCGADTDLGWTGEVCRDDKRKGFGGCGYVHRRLMKKPAYRYLTHTFRRGVQLVDELSEIRGESLRSKSIRALHRGPFKYGGTGTPLSNYVHDCFWGLWWTLGNATPAFPYDYASGRAKFVQDFCVVQHTFGREKDGLEHRKMGSKTLPKITNVSQFWRLTQPGMVRCRQEQTGEPMVPRRTEIVRVPMGIHQRQAHEFWLNNFAQFFKEKNPDHNLVALGLVEQFEAMLGQRWKVEYVSTMPAADVEGYKWEPLFKPEKEQMEALRPRVSNWTPGNLKMIEIALEHVRKGEKVLIGSDLIATGEWAAERLKEKNVKAVHLVEEKDGKLATKNPKKRACDVQEFVTGDAQVLCCGIPAMKLGHNLDVASVVIVNGLPDSFMMMDQFIKRVHRLTSKKDVTVYVILPKGSLAETKYEVLKDKGGSSDLAFDGELIPQNEQEVDWNKILREMKKNGCKTDNDEIDEEDVRAQFQKIEALPAKTGAPKPREHRSPERPWVGRKVAPKDLSEATKQHGWKEWEDPGPIVDETKLEAARKKKEEKRQVKSKLFDTPLPDTSAYVQASLFDM